MESEIRNLMACRKCSRRNCLLLINSGKMSWISTLFGPWAASAATSRQISSRDWHRKTFWAWSTKPTRFKIGGDGTSRCLKLIRRLRGMRNAIRIIWNRFRSSKTVSTPKLRNYPKFPECFNRKMGRSMVEVGRNTGYWRVRIFPNAMKVPEIETRHSIWIMECLRSILGFPKTCPASTSRKRRLFQKISTKVLEISRNRK